MNLAIAAFGLVMLGVSPALSAGSEQVMVPDPGGVPLEVGIWYPSKGCIDASLLIKKALKAPQERGGRRNCGG